MGYLSSLGEHQHGGIDNHLTCESLMNTKQNKVLDRQTLLFNQLWQMLNPSHFDRVNLRTSTNLIHLLMLNVIHKSDKELSHIIANFLMEHYTISRIIETLPDNDLT